MKAIFKLLILNFLTLVLSFRLAVMMISQSLN